MGKLQKLFDYQRFANNKRLSALISDAENFSAHALSDDDLEFVNAAGDLEATLVDEEDNDDDN